MTSEQNERDMSMLCRLKAAELWKAFTPNERAAVRFGMMPAAPMQAATAEGYDCRLLSVALMGCAERQGGMVA